MTAIWIDPADLTAGATLLGRAGVDLRDLSLGLINTCTCEVPASLTGYVSAELEQITISVLQGAIVLLEQAIDVKRRADQVTAEQAATYAASATIGGFAPYATSSGTVSLSDLYGMGSTVGGHVIASEATVGGTPISEFGLGATFTVGGVSREQFLANNPLLAAMDKLQTTNPAAAAQLAGLQNSINRTNSNIIGTWTLSRPGATYIGDGLYSGNGNIGTISDVYRRGNGEYEVR